MPPGEEKKGEKWEKRAKDKGMLLGRLGMFENSCSKDRQIKFNDIPIILKQFDALKILLKYCFKSLLTII